MIGIESRTDAIIRLGERLADKLKEFKSNEDNDLKVLISKAKFENQWFTESNILLALESWVEALKPANVKKWLEPYMPVLIADKRRLNIGVVNAGNIPFVGMHDLLTVILCGYSYTGKNATGDSLLLPFFASILIASLLDL